MDAIPPANQWHGQSNEANPMMTPDAPQNPEGQAASSRAMAEDDVQKLVDQQLESLNDNGLNRGEPKLYVDVNIGK